MPGGRALLELYPQDHPMSLVLAVANQKGGVGKSTTAVNLAATFATQYGLRTLVIDMDGQCNATAALMGMDWQAEYTIKDVLWDPRAISEVMVPTRHDPRLLIVAGSPELSYYEKSIEPHVWDDMAGSPELSYYEKSIEPHVWDDIVQEARATLLNGLPDDIDVVILDTPPTLGLWLNTALGASDAALVVCWPDSFSLSGMTQVLETIAHIRDVANSGLGLAGLLVNNVRTGVREHDGYLTLFRTQFPDLMLEPPILQRTVFSEAQRLAVPVQWMSDRAAPEVRRWYGQIVGTILERCGVSPAQSEEQVPGNARAASEAPAGGTRPMRGRSTPATAGAATT
jgi:chromosome partitioning protein